MTMRRASPRRLPITRCSSGISALIKERFFSCAMVLGVAFLLLVSLVVSAGIGAAGGFLQDSLAGGEFLWQGRGLGVPEACKP